LIQEEKNTISESELIAKIDKKYEKDIAQLSKNPASKEELIAREKTFQQTASKKIAENEQKLKQTESISLEAENKVLLKLVDDSQARIESIEKQILAAKTESKSVENNTQNSNTQNNTAQNNNTQNENTVNKTSNESVENKTSESQNTQSYISTIQETAFEGNKTWLNPSVSIESEDRSAAKKALNSYKTTLETEQAKVQKLKTEISKEEKTKRLSDLKTEISTVNSILSTIQKEEESEKQEQIASLENQLKNENLTAEERTELITKLIELKPSAKSQYSDVEKNATSQSIEKQSSEIIESIIEKSNPEIKRFLNPSVSIDFEDKIEALVQLQSYKRELESKKSEIEQSKKEYTKEQKQGIVTVLVEEIERVDRRISSLKEEVKTEESNINLTSENKSIEKNSSDEAKLAELKTKMNENLSKSEEKELKKEISTLENKVLNDKNEKNTTQIQENQTFITKQRETWIDLGNSPSMTSKKTSITAEINSFEAEKNKIDQEIKKLKNTTSDNRTKNELQNQLLIKQEKIVEKIDLFEQEALLIDAISKNSFSNDTKETYYTEKKLNNRKYSVQVELAEVNQKIITVDEQLITASKKEKPVLENQKNELLTQKFELENELITIEKEIKKRNVELPSSVDSKAMNQSISYEEEVKIASSKEYSTYFNLQKEFLETKKSLTSVDKQLVQKRESLDELIQMKSTEKGKIETLVVQVSSLESEKLKLQNKLAVLQTEISDYEKTIDDNTERMKLQNLIMRGIEPITVIAVLASSVPIPAEGFEFNPNTAGNAKRMEIPAEASSPSGLIYRVQVGAFAKPIPEERFNEFSPVSGEKLPSGITRYMAGFFTSRDNALNAQGKIRGIGYADAFTVAYCDGKRISLDEARRLEQSGQCLPKGVDELVLEIAENTAKAILDDTLKAKGLKNDLGAYNKAPGAAPAIAVETKLGLFYTVQLGVFNKPVPHEALKKIEPLITKRLANGQIRYSAGIFDNLQDAQPKRDEAKARGIKDAFITAYYKGERITLEEAEALMNQNGSSILENKMPVENKILAVEEIKKIEEETKKVEPVFIPQEVKVRDEALYFVSKKQYEEFPHDIIRRFNGRGMFYYDQEDRRVKSIVYKNEDYVPQVYYFRTEIDTVYVRDLQENNNNEKQVFHFESASENLSGDFVNWFIRMGYQRELSKSIVTNKNSLIITTYKTLKENELQELKAQLKTFGWKFMNGNE
jgi:epidermal growth factor receptor substrate 15